MLLFTVVPLTLIICSHSPHKQNSVYAQGREGEKQKDNQLLQNKLQCLYVISRPPCHTLPTSEMVHSNALGQPKSG